MATFNLKAPVFNFTKNYFPSMSRPYQQLPSVNRLNSACQDESVAIQEAVAVQDTEQKPLTTQATVQSTSEDLVPVEDAVTCQQCNLSVDNQQQRGDNEENNQKLIFLKTAAHSSTKQIVSPRDKKSLHPLQNFWTLWYLENDVGKSWKEKLNEMATFGTVEDFWDIYTHIKLPSELGVGCDYSVFKRGICPMWEDEANIEGGRWVITLNRPADGEVNEMWLNILASLIGESFENSNEVCGAVVNIRFKVFKISVWTANGENEDAVLEIGKKLREILQLGPKQLQYQVHKDSMTTHSSMVQPLYVL